MKSVTASEKAILESGAKVYTRAIIDAYNINTERDETFTLQPEDFSATGNSYTQNGGYDFAIGNVLSKSVTLTIINENKRFNKYKMEEAKVRLYSVVNYGEENQFVIPEGYFYVEKVEYVARQLKLTAYDAAYFMEGKYAIRTAAPGSTTPTYATLWDYFVYLCDEVLAGKLGITLSSGRHMYSENIENGFINSDMPMAAIQGEGSPSTTLRDIFGYIAQLAAGNIVFGYEYSNPVIDIVSYNLPQANFYYGGTFNDNITASIDGETFAETTTNKRIECGLFTDNDYIFLNKYDTQTIAHGESYYTKVTITYPRTNSSSKGSASYHHSNNPSKNVLALDNPLCQTTADGSQKVINCATNIYKQICGNVSSYDNDKFIKPFEGKYPQNILAEFMDNCVVVDNDGQAFPSFVGNITYNYLGNTSIENKTPTLPQKNRLSI